MDIYEALYTTRAMRRLRPDPIPLDVQARILDAAIRAPSEPNARRFLLVDDPDLRRQLGALYLAAWEQFVDPSTIPPEFSRVFRSGDHLARHFAEVPLLLFGFGQGGTGGSIYPALQSAMLAARQRASAARSRCSLVPATTRCWRSPGRHRRRAGACSPASRWVTRPAGGAWLRAVPSTR